MAVISISGSRRDTLGKNAARKSRAAGQIPGVMYGHGEEPVAVSVDARTFQLALRHHKGGNAIVNLAVNGSEYTTLIRAVQYDPVSHHVMHLDFQHISLTETVEVSVAVQLVGLPIGVKDGGGILEHITREVEVRCLPTAIPPSIDLDVSALNVGDSIHVSAMQVVDVTILTDPETTVATVVAPSVVEEKPVEEAAAATATAEPEVIAKGKKEEEEAGEKKEPAKDAGKEKK